MLMSLKQFYESFSFSFSFVLRVGTASAGLAYVPVCHGTGAPLSKV